QGHTCDQPNAHGTVACTRSGRTHSEKISEFGSTACKSLYRCCDCREPFDYFKCI
ncbi:PaaD-like zinc ribbon domain-containing protein, partial [Pseudomonas aeruginosa]